jgi:purine-nucleoside phosphorylase
MICYAFPLAHEAELLVKHSRERESFRVDGLHCTVAQLGRRRVLIARIGMGEAAAADNTGTVFDYFKLRAFILAGYGGALVPPLKVGQVLVSSNFTSEAVLGFLRMFSGFDFAAFATVDDVLATPEQREAVAASTEAHVCDMETQIVTELVRERQIPFLAVRAISDEFSTLLPVGALAAGFDPSQNKPTPLKFLARLARHPGEIRPMIDFIGNLAVARRNLTRFLEQLNAELPASW